MTIAVDLGRKAKKTSKSTKFYNFITILLFVLFSGKVQRMLVYLGKFQARHAADTLLQAIKISHATDHNLG